MAAESGSKRLNEGVVIGKFYPPHRCHKYLIETALAHCEHLVVFVCDVPGKLPAALRAAWLREIHPSADVRVIADTVPDDDSKGWAEYTIATLGYTPDAVFTSEDYGHAYARFMGCVHVQVDKVRANVPISATRIRADAFACWDYLEPCVRAWFACRVCLAGAESTGKTTLAQALAHHFETTWTPEFGRYYWQGRGGLGRQPDWRSEEFEFIAGVQSAWENRMARLANRILICDTNAFATRLDLLSLLFTSLERIRDGVHRDAGEKIPSPGVERIGGPGNL